LLCPWQGTLRWLSTGTIQGFCCIPGKLNVLPLIVAYGYPGGSVHEHIGRLQDRVGQEAEGCALNASAQTVVE